MGIPDLDFEYEIGVITDGNGKPIPDVACVSIVRAGFQSLLLGDIDINAPDAKQHAKLIAAAPDMLAALKKIIAAAEDGDEMTAIALATAALSKATGEA